MSENKAKMDPEKAPAPVKKLIDAAQDDLVERECIRQYIEESSVGISGSPGEPLSPLGETQPGEWEYADDEVKYVKSAFGWTAVSGH